METNKEKENNILSKEYNLLEQLSIYIKIQNIQLLKLIANNEKWDFRELLNYLK
jgi:hypothetical protein